jgi:capsule polysaccharide export protein KpsE/RkpR
MNDSAKASVPAVEKPGLDGEPKDEPGPSLVDVLVWIGRGKRVIAVATMVGLAASLAVAFMLRPVYTARTTLLPPITPQQGGSAAAMAALGALGGVAGGLGAKTADELYVALLRSDSVWRALDERFNLRQHYEAGTHEALRRALPNYVRVSSDKKSGIITVEVDDKDAKFAADLANAHVGEVTRVLGRLALSEAQQRRAFFELQLRKTKDDLVKAETELRLVQEKSGVIALDKQAEALIGGVAQMRASVAEREVRLKVLRTGATAQNPDVIRLVSELGALRSELARMESSRGSSSSEIPVGKLPEAAVAYVRARRELKMQETLMEAMLRQFELAKMDEAKEGPLLQQVDPAMPPDYRSKPSRLLVALAGTLVALAGSALLVIVRSYSLSQRPADQASRRNWATLRGAWRLRA